MESLNETQKSNRKRRGKYNKQRFTRRGKKAMINPNTIWETRKRATGCNGLEYDTINEEGRRITDPQETKHHIADYFEDLYQAREGTEEYNEWTKEIKATAQAPLKHHKPITENDNGISSKEFNTVIKRLKRKKSLAPDKIPNEIFIEANSETRRTLKIMIERAHSSEVIPQAWEEGEMISPRCALSPLGEVNFMGTHPSILQDKRTLQRKECERKMLQRKGHHTCEQCREGV